MLATITILMYSTVCKYSLRIRGTDENQAYQIYRHMVIEQRQQDSLPWQAEPLALSKSDSSRA